MQIEHIIIVDDHPLVRSGLRQLLEAEADFNVCCEAANIAQAQILITKYTPDLAVIDLSLPDGNGLDLIKRVHLQHPDTLMLVLSMHDEDMFAERVIHAGANGYINKQESGEQFIAAIRQVLDHKTYLSPHLAERLNTDIVTDTQSPQLSPSEKLSNRELEVFELIGHGMATGMIAKQLHLSIKTIESHRANIKSKLGLHSAGELTRSAVQWTIDIK